MLSRLRESLLHLIQRDLTPLALQTYFPTFDFLLFLGENNPCQNNGTCIEDDSNFSCECLPGFTGQFCEQSKIFSIFEFAESYEGIFFYHFFKISELPNDYVVTFGASDSFGTSEYALLEGKPFPNLTEVKVH